MKWSETFRRFGLSQPGEHKTMGKEFCNYSLKAAVENNVKDAKPANLLTIF